MKLLSNPLINAIFISVLITYIFVIVSCYIKTEESNKLKRLWFSVKWSSIQTFTATIVVVGMLFLGGLLSKI